MEARELLDLLDSTWYSLRRPRWMDLLGDYVGEEFFLIDGDAICQQVLNDPLLALGKSQDCSFQLLHAVWSVEKLVSEFVRRRCNFEIVFFERNEYLTLYGGDETSTFVVSSRRLARTILKTHLERLDIPVSTFKTPVGGEWLDFVDSKQPICVLCNDGSQFATTNSDDLALGAALLQRTFIFIMLSQGISVISLEATEFRGPKIVSWVYEKSRLLTRRKILMEFMFDCRRQALRILLSSQPRQSTSPSTIPTDQVVEPWVRAATDEYFQFNPIDASNDAIFAVFLLHIIVLPYVSMGDRSQKPVILHPDLESTLRTHVMPQIFDALNEGLMTDGIKRRPDLDGRIFLNLLAVFTQNSGPSEDLTCLLGHGAASAAGLVASSLHRHVEAGRLSFSPSALSIALCKWHYNEVASLPPAQEKTIMSLLPFQNDVFDECLKPIHSASEVVPSATTSSDSSIASAGNGNEVSSEAAGWFTNSTTFTDDQHWHNNRKIVEAFKEKRLVLYGEKRDYDRPLTKWQLARRRKKEETRRQKLMRDVYRNAATLTGAKGAPLQRLVIPATKISIKNLLANKLLVQRRSNPPPLQEHSRPKKEPKSKEPKLNSTERLRQQIKEEKATKLLSASEAWWKQQLARMENLPTLERKVEHLNGIQRNAKRMEDPWLRTETLLYQVHLNVSQWIYDGGSEDPQVQAQYCVNILRAASEIHNIGVASDAAKKFLRSLLEAIGFSDLDILKSSSVKSTETTKKLLTFQPVRFAHRDRTKPPLYPFLRLPSHPINFQLQHYGLYMDRSMDGQVDPRVSFVPDAWQRKVLDRLDRRESVLVVAPTSAGKTFISYYAMEQVLRESDDGVLVYVAPTKPLVNQVVSEISARFGKTLGTGTVWAAHYRDWRVHEPHKCQILVTVPEMLAIMLLSPVLAAQWLPRLRWIVLDEIHSIGQQEGGAVWEQLILFAPCPIIGLSATIGNPEEFSQWLESVQEQHGFKYALIQHKHRYSHLRKFAYTMSREPPEFKGFTSTPPSSVKPIYIHPMSALISGTRVIPEDLALESGDCLTLFHAMSKVAEQRAEKRDQLAKLDSSSFFAPSYGRLLTQKDVLDYEAELKALLADWSKEVEAHKNILRPIGEALSEGHNLCEPYPTVKGIYDNLIHLLHDLQQRGNLPAILFNFDRADCEKMARHLVKTLQTAEIRWKESNPQWQNKLKKWEAWTFKQRQSGAERPKKSEPQGDEAPVGSKSWEESFDPEEPLPEFSFAGPWTSYSKAEMERDIHELKDKSRKPVKDWQIEALKLGIAVHHAGMGHAYRSLVESLFRIGFVRVVIATGTLALGINMPVKTSIFIGDSVFLTALTYRQCAGRAGRRGMDLVGNVVFYGIPVERIHQIMTSKVPPLTGNMPLTTTLSLRLFSLLHGSQQAASAVNAINSILRLPQLSLGSEIGRDELLHHLRFSIDYLRRTNLISVNGEPLIMFPLIAHLYHTEPYNLALVALLQNGVIHRICDSIDLNPIDTKRNLVGLFAHLFARRPFPRLFSGEGALERLRPPKSPSQIILPPLSPDAYRVISEHNDLILEIFRGYARTFATQHLSNSSDNLLPLSEETLPTSSDQDATFMSLLRRRANNVVTTSSFVANSGVTDTSLGTVVDLSRTTRVGLHLDKNAMPGLDTLLDGRVLNAYILDYFTHGQWDTLTTANGIRENDVWYLLEEFSLALATLQTGLEHYLKAVAADPNLDSESSDEEEDGAEEGESGSETEAEAEAEAQQFEPGATSIFPMKPQNISDGDWKVYRAVVLTKQEFDEKFRPMWA
ncbi:hypothetical protein M407DRAFT_213307 [Tulasnella calospora MUT 4182]|uniref:Helicase ATP-binding domain-containing protein n=1 Tax=Tulasnella calospora MUT 4182 TaxID=1051891 RepID=A0A0C3QFQ7_9AGAM|nr:hypothetical protein M407DRAFT_213307 [Tulasnella calospora MUT 4182]